MINKETYKRLTANGEKINIHVNLQLAQIYNRLAELEDKIESGTLIELLYKAGDTAIAIIDTLAYNNSVQKVKIKGLAYIVEDENGDTTFQHISRIFPNEKEAEATLKEFQENKK